MGVLVDSAYLLAAVLLGPSFLYKMLRHKRYRRGWAQRFGKITRSSSGKKSIWIHAVSVGEVNATRTLLKQLEEKFPEFEIVVSTTTDTGFARAAALYGDEHCVFYFPFDLSFVMRRVFDKVQPAMCLLMELEVWPNFVETARRLNVPVVIVNGRITNKSCNRYKIIKPFAKRIFQKVTLVLAQTQTYAQRFASLGIPGERIKVTGSLKYDTAQITDKIEGSDIIAEQLKLDESDRLWVAGGTGDDEEKILLDVYKNLKQQFDNLRFVIVPRKPERFDLVAQLITEAGLEFVRYSSLKQDNKKLEKKVDVILGDTMGDLRKFYSLATIVFVGRSLVPMGGSDMIEAVALGKPTLFGSHTFNFSQTVEDLLAKNGAIEVKNGAELLSAIQKCLSEPAYAEQIARNGRDVVRQNQGATRRTIEQIETLLRPGK